MFQYLDQKIPTLDTDTDVYRCEGCFTFLHSVCMFCFASN